MHRKNFSHFLSARKTPCLTQSLNSKKTSLIVVGLHVEDSNGNAITHMSFILVLFLLKLSGLMLTVLKWLVVSNDKVNRKVL